MKTSKDQIFLDVVIIEFKRNYKNKEELINLIKLEYQIQYS